MSTNDIPSGLLVSGEARDRFGLNAFVDERGAAALPHMVDVRRLAAILNRASHTPPPTDPPIRAGQIGAVAWLDQVSRFLIGRFRDQHDPDLLDQARLWVSDDLGEQSVSAAVRRFRQVFPPESIRRQGAAAAEPPAGEDSDFVVDLLAVWLLNQNPAVGPIVELFDDSSLPRDTYEAIIDSLDRFFSGHPPGPDGKPLVAFLRAHIDRGGDTLDAQIDYLRRRIGHLLPTELLRQLLTALDVLKEEKKAFRAGPPGAGPVEPPSFEGLEAGGERFSQDRDWMPELVLIAKNAHVWLSQLSRRYGRDINRLDQIPDQELHTFARRGITGLWLIGLWQRSAASGRIKRLSGSPHAVSSAYSIDDYRIAPDLGGQQAWDDLRRRARRCGVRMAADMVPNHMGITSRWVVDHPERFLDRPDPPYPGYSFDGPDLSDRDGVGIFVEDHYYDRSDAAVVFKRVDYQSGQTRYIYHGNDGTSMPWNDTAQIDYLDAEAREAVIDQILAVAQKCSVIRFDAAMTLVKKHIQRLWYPKPGSGGAIPSRADFGMTRQDFDQMAPREFWTEVVERIGRQAPDTLLLAEAFWMMEGYFVRSLGMHRVYNSAFMNMLSDEDNAGYRQVMKDTLEFNPQILRRYVNFMNNPDEETAVAQFGAGDKYFGVCTLMATMPGLPMFGHGQIEGFVEKYGMDFNEPRLDEQPDEGFVDRHRREIFGLLRRRRVFAGIQHFLLYDVYTDDHDVDENVYAYSNRVDDQPTLVVYHNRYAQTAGWIRQSVAYRESTDDDSHGELVQQHLIDGLDLDAKPGRFVTFRDQLSGLEYIRSTAELAEHGFLVSLGAYDCHVFIDFAPLDDVQGNLYRRLADRLDGRGAPSLEAELRHMQLRPLHKALEAMLSADLVAELDRGDARRAAFTALSPAERRLAAKVKEFGGTDDVSGYVEEVHHDLQVLQAFQARLKSTAAIMGAGQHVHNQTLGTWATLWAWAILRPIGGLAPGDENGLRARSLFDEWSLQRVIADFFDDVGAPSDAGGRAVDALRFGLNRQRWLTDDHTWGLEPTDLLDELLDDPDARAYLGINRHDDTTWFHGEFFDPFMDWLARFGALGRAVSAARSGQKINVAVPGELHDRLATLRRAAEHADYRVDRLFEYLDDR